MALKKVSAMSLEELKSKENILKRISPIFAVVIVIMISIGSHLTLKDGFGAFTVLPIIFVGVFISNTFNLKSIRKEIAERSEYFNISSYTYRTNACKINIGNDCCMNNNQ